jgi:hypothetical protein
MDPRYYNTYSMRSPLKTHWRSANCEEYECDEFLNGFVVTVDLTTELGQRQAYYLRNDRSRRCHEQRVSMELIKFVYGPGNRCFRSDEHRVPIGKPAKLLVVGGDWRGNPNQYHRLHTRLEYWVEDFALNQQRLAEIQRRG